MGDLAQLVRDNIEFGDGEDSWSFQSLECEACGSTEFRIWFSGPVGTMICVDCSKPQESVICVEVDDD